MQDHAAASAADPHTIPKAESAPQSPERHRELVARCAVLVRRAVLTLAVLPDKEQGWLTPLEGNRARTRSSMPAVVMSEDDHKNEYGLEAWGELVKQMREIESRRARRFKPTPADIDRCFQVWGWLTWLAGENAGRRDLQLIVARSHGAPFWKLATRFGRSEDTIRRWENAAFQRLTGRFWAELEALGP